MRTDRTFVILFLVILVSIWSPLRGDRFISCLLGSSCLLPCPFDPGPEVVIHWLHPPDATASVHSFYHDSDQLARQLPRYRGRTRLFHTQISQGDASLLLSGLQLQDRGRYKCYTSTIKGNSEDFITVDVQAPVSEVSLEEDGQFLNCSSKGVFPTPRVSWTPPSEHSPSVKPAESGLYSVNSSVPLTDSSPHEYTCNISTETSWRSATYRRTDGVTWSGSTAVLSCFGKDETINSLKWTFNRTQNILTRTGSNTVYSPDWETRLDKEPGSDLVLKDLTQDHQGIYSCALITDRSTYLTVTEVTVATATTADQTVIAAVISTVVVVVLLAIVGFLIYRWYKNRQTRPKEPSPGLNGEEASEMLNPPKRTSAESSQPNEVQPSK